MLQESTAPLSGATRARGQEVLRRPEPSPKTSLVFRPQGTEQPIGQSRRDQRDAEWHTTGTESARERHGAQIHQVDEIRVVAQVRIQGHGISLNLVEGV